MPEETIFQGQNTPNQAPSPAPSQNIPPVVPPTPQNPQPSAPPVNAPSSPPPPPPDHGESIAQRLNFKKILAVVGAVFLILVLIFIFIALILPRLSPAKEESVTLSYWGTQEEESVMRPVIADFEKENPNIKVEYVKQDPEDYREKIQVRTQNGTGPDIFRFHNTWYPMLSEILLPLPKETIEKQVFESSFYQAAQNDLIKNGAIIGIPIQIDNLVMFVNTDILDATSSAGGGAVTPPVTWQEFIETSQRLTTRDETGKISISGGGIGTFNNVVHAPDIISLLFAQNGVDLGDITKSEQKVIDALQFYTNFALVENNIWDDTLDQTINAFAQGKLAFFFGYSYDYFSVRSLNPSLKFKIYPVPQLLEDKPVNIASYFAEGVSSKSTHQKEALLFMSYLARPQVQEKLFAEASKTRAFGQPYSNRNLADKLQDSEVYPVIAEAETAVSSPFVDSTFDNGLNDKLNAVLKNTINSILNNQGVEEGVRGLIEGYNQVMSEYNKTPL